MNRQSTLKSTSENFPLFLSLFLKEKKMFGILKDVSGWSIEFHTAKSGTIHAQLYAPNRIDMGHSWAGRKIDSLVVWFEKEIAENRTDGQ